MGIQGVGFIERVLRRLFIPIVLGSGVIVVSGFFFPDYVGQVISGRGWLTISLLFFGAGLGYLAVLPTETDEATDADEPHYLLRINKEEIVDNANRFLSGHDPITFGIPVVALGIFFVVHWLAAPQLDMAIGTIREGLTVQLSWMFSGVMVLSVLFCVYLVLGKWGDVRLGGPDIEPSYTYPVYFSMIFTAGIAAGIVLSAPSEPLLHYGNPPPLNLVPAESSAAVDAAMAYALFHWGFTAWSAYLVLGLPIAYFVYEYGAPLRVSAILTPFLGVKGVTSPVGKLVDVLAIFATIGGIATSVALVGQQFLSGIGYQWNVSVEMLGPLVFVTGLTGIFVLSAQSGVHRGIRRIAGLNLILFIGFAGLLLAVGPRGTIVDIGLSGTSGYAVDFIPMSLQFGYEWVADWTIWNWAWWFSWAPFAGMFLAALSRGRTIRSVVLTGVGATGLATVVWFIIFGSTALHVQHAGIVDVLATVEAHADGTAVAGFPILDALPFGDFLIFLFLALIIVFITTSADTSTLIVSILATEEGTAPTTASIVFWGIVQGIVAVFVLVTGSEEVLQGAAVLTGGPFAVIAIVAMIGLLLALQERTGRYRSLPVRLWNRIPERPM